MQNGTLYIVGTPIGNLDDITLRALETLKTVEVVFCEDTRITKRLLERHGVQARLESLNARTERGKVQQALAYLEEGISIAYVSDAGTPAISDPGALLVQKTRERGFAVAVVPGPSALTAALSITGVPASEFLFLGFLPHKKGRQTFLKEIAASKRTVVVYESTHRITKLLAELEENLAGTRQICIARELTKVYEEVLCGTAAELRELLEHNAQKQKGEFVVTIAPF